MKKIGKNKKISILLGLIAILNYSNYTFASVGAVIQNVDPAGTGPGKWPAPRFESAKKADNSTCADAEYDKLTGLMWAKDGNAAGPKIWTDAKTYANTLNLCGYNDWRLPTINELASLVNYSDTASPLHWLNSNGFNNIQPGYYWSSNVYSLSGGIAWFVNMGSGSVLNGSQASNNYVLPVRGPN